MKKKRIQSLTVIIGALLALAIVFSQLFQFQVNSCSKKEVKTEAQKAENRTHETYVSFTSFSLPTSVNVLLTLDSYCLFEISFEESQQETRSSEIPLHPEKFLQTLFSVIISPNAP